MDDLIPQLSNFLRARDLGTFEQYQQVHGANKYAFIMSVRAVIGEATSTNDYDLLKTTLEAGRYVVAINTTSGDMCGDMCMGIRGLHEFLNSSERDLHRLAHAQKASQNYEFPPSQIPVGGAAPSEPWVAPSSLARPKALPSDEETAAQLFTELNMAHASKRQLSFVLSKSENAPTLASPYQRSKKLMALVAMRQLPSCAKHTGDISAISSHFLQLLVEDRS